ncbi:glycerol kinase [Candidatus Izimaplasma bacterium ZiA1]|uniref:glycerol kinase GlpK n=1 Tax=Candidatus Izimoplasma sp. ZiA1 TaxID=2024899 RepID=UPI000BAA63A1|nr:glycerol kinase [Candidatus Izimaplasma bacterium ZiA1]
MKKYILAIDQGTSSTRTIIFDIKGNIVSSSQLEIDMIYQEAGYVEQDAYQIWTSVLYTMANALLHENIEAHEIASIGITNQRETTILWDRRTGTPVYKAIVWQSRQSESICEELRSKNLQSFFKNKTGLVIDPYFSGTKIKWVIDNVDGVKKLMDEGNLMFGTVDSWILYKLSGHKVHKTDHTNASRTLLYNIFTKEWDQEILDLLNIDKRILPEVCDSNSIFGNTASHTFFGEEVPVSGILGDQQAALFGQLCLKEGDVKNTYGTGCFMLMNTGEKQVISEKGLLTTIAYSLDGKVTYALEGSVFVAGSAIQWLRDSLKFFDDAKDSEEFANKVDDTLGVVVVPAFTGLGTPYWDAECKGAIFGLTRGANQYHITRATLESLAYQTKDIIEVMNAESNIKTNRLKVDGGASLNNYLMQFQSDILDVEILRPKIFETTALGAAYMAGLSTNFFKDTVELQQITSIDKSYYPDMNSETREKLYKRWLTAIKSAQTFK